MKQIRSFILIVFLGFVIFVIKNDDNVPSHYYTSYETYYISNGTNEIIVPVFSTSKDIIFFSDRPYYYLCANDISYNIKRNYCRYVKDYTFLNNKLGLYLVSFSLGIYDCKKIDNVYLKVEYNSVEFMALIGNIIISDANVYSLNGIAFEGGVKCQGNLNIINNEFVDCYIYDYDSLNTIIYLNNRNIYNYVFIQDVNDIYIWQNYNVDLKMLALYEEKYVKDN